LNEHNVEQIAALQYVSGRLLAVLAYGDKIDDASPFPLADPTERDKFPPIGNPRTQRPEYGLCPSPGRIRFNMRRRVRAHAYNHPLIN
jgi:hypothetical protein